MGRGDGIRMPDCRGEELRLNFGQVFGLPVVAPAFRLGGVEQALLRDIRSPLNNVAYRRAEGFDWSDKFFAVG